MAKQTAKKVRNLQGTTLSMEEDMRMKLTRARILPPLLQTLPANDSFKNTPGVDDDDLIYNEQRQVESLRDIMKCLRVRGVRLMI